MELVFKWHAKKWTTLYKSYGLVYKFPENKEKLLIFFIQYQSRVFNNSLRYSITELEKLLTTYWHGCDEINI